MRKILRFVCGCCLLAAAFFIGWTYYIYITAPVEKLQGIIEYHPPYRDFVRHAGLGVPGNVTLEEMPIELILATLVAEDPEFATHHGIRWDLTTIGLAEYFLYSADHWKGQTRIPMLTDPSASTITQQLAKNVFFTAAHNLYRKYKEGIYAMRLEHTYSKAQIFTLYASIAETGAGVYGYREAARTYFHKDVRQLTPAECAFIASVLTSPVRLTKGFTEGKGVNDFVVARMLLILTRTMELKASLPQSTYVPDTAKEQIFSYMRAHPQWEPDETVSAIPEDNDVKMVQSARAMVDAFIHAHGK